MKNSTLIAGGAAIAGVIVILVLLRKSATDVKGAVSKAAGTVGAALNPLASTNLAARAADAITQALTGDPKANLANTFYEFLNPNRVRADAPAGSRAAPPGAGQSAPAGSSRGVDLGGYYFAGSDDQDASMGRFTMDPFDANGNGDRHEPLTIEIIGNSTSPLATFDNG